MVPLVGDKLLILGAVPAPEALDLIVHANHQALAENASPFRLGTAKCCALLKTKALLDALREHGIDAAVGGARRDEEKSRAKELAVFDPHLYIPVRRIDEPA